MYRTVTKRHIKMHVLYLSQTKLCSTVMLKGDFAVFKKQYDIPKQLLMKSSY